MSTGFVFVLVLFWLVYVLHFLVYNILTLLVLGCVSACLIVSMCVCVSTDAGLVHIVDYTTKHVFSKKL